MTPFITISELKTPGSWEDRAADVYTAPITTVITG